VTLRLEYDPATLAENAAAALGLVKARVHGDLARFEEFIQKRGQETGAWRGTIKKGSVSGDEPSSY
jgi:hypothetical protein